MSLRWLAFEKSGAAVGAAPPRRRAYILRRVRKVGERGKRGAEGERRNLDFTTERGAVGGKTSVVAAVKVVRDVTSALEKQRSEELETFETGVVVSRNRRERFRKGERVSKAASRNRTETGASRKSPGTVRG